MCNTAEALNLYNDNHSNEVLKASKMAHEDSDQNNNYPPISSLTRDNLGVGQG